MDKIQQKKLVIGIGSVVLLLCMILGVLVYNQSPQNTQKDTTTTTPTRPSLPNGDKDKITPSADSPSPRHKGTSTTTPDALQSVGLCTVYVNNMYNAAFLGICGWLTRSLFSSRGLPTNLTLFKLSILHYLVAALVGYILYFFYQNYAPANNLSPDSLPNDMGLIALMGVLTGLVFVALSRRLVTTSEKRLQDWQSNLQRKTKNLNNQKQELEITIKDFQKGQQEMKKEIARVEKLYKNSQKSGKTKEETKKESQQLHTQQQQINTLQNVHKKAQENIRNLQTQQQQITKDLQNLRNIKPSIKVLNRQLLAKTLISCGIILIAYTIAINVIEYFKSNHKIKCRKFDSMRLFSMFILTGIWRTMAYKSKSKIASMLLWTIAACFLYVQAFWEPKRSAIGHKKIEIGRAHV